jgi:hypothetical protein
MHSPAIAADEDITQLVHDIHGVSRKPPRGAPPAAVQTATDAQTGYSAAATAVARFFVERTEHGLFADPQLDVDELAKETGLSVDDTRDALYELSGFLKISHNHVMVEGALFAEFDRYWKPWNPAADALRVAADIVNDPAFPAGCNEIAEHYGWEPRRLNSVISYMLERDLIIDRQAMGTQPWAIISIGQADPIRRFVKRRS